MAILNDLTDSLVSKILIMLPVKSLMQCICVCKSWYNLVSDPYFIRSHLSLKSADEKEYLVVRFRRGIFTTDHYYSFRCNETLVEKLKVKCPISELAWGCRIAGICIGLLLMLNLNRSVSDMYLWNPSLKKIKPLPSAHATYKFKFRLEALGLAFLPEDCDYKVIRILNFSSDDFSVAEIYSLKTDSWRRIETPVNRLISRCNGPLSAAFVNPFFYWVGAENHGNIVSFNLKCETFKTTSLPDACLAYGRLEGYRVVFQESLSELSLFTFRFGEGWSLWTLKENDSSGMSCLKICKFPFGIPAGFMKNGDVIIEDLKDEVSLLDPNGDVIFEDLKDDVSLLDPRNVSNPRNPEYEIRWGRTCSGVYNYSPSLALLLDERNGGL